MQKDKSKFKDEFKRRVYKFVLEIIKFVDELPKEKSSEIIVASSILTLKGKK